MPAPRWPEASHHHLATPAVLNQDRPSTHRGSVACTGTAQQATQQGRQSVRSLTSKPPACESACRSVPQQLRCTQSITPRSHYECPEAGQPGLAQFSTSGVHVCIALVQHQLEHKQSENHLPKDRDSPSLAGRLPASPHLPGRRLLNYQNDDT